MAIEKHTPTLGSGGLYLEPFHGRAIAPEKITSWVLHTDHDGGRDLEPDGAIGEIYGRDEKEASEYAALIVRACNSHDALVKALELALPFLEREQRGCDYEVAPLTAIRAALKLARTP